MMSKLHPYSEKTNKLILDSLQNQFRLLFFMIASIHFLLAVISLIFGKYYFAAYQAFSVIFYLFLLKFWKEKRIVLFYILCFIEMTANSFLTEIAWGNTYSSELYLVDLSLIANCIAFTSYSDKAKFIFMIINSISCAIAFLGIKVVPSAIFSFVKNVQNNAVNFSSAGLIMEIFYIFTSFSLIFVIMLFFIQQIYQDFGKVQKEKKELDTIASHDPLTGLYNRRKMEQLLQECECQWQGKGQPFVVGMSDIDHFKKFNDTYGHSAGDAVLQRIASVFMTSLRDEDIVSRWGGEEFLFVFHCTESEAVPIAERLRRKINETPVKFQDMDLFVSMTFGLSEISEHQSIQELIEQADKNLYEGKNKGRNCVICDGSNFQKQ